MKRSPIVLGLLYMMASAASAGDYMEGYFWIIGSVKARPLESYSYREFASERMTVVESYQSKCGIDDFTVWHSDFMDNMKPHLWVVYTALEDTKEQALALVGRDSCSKAGYVKQGYVTFPGVWAYCTSNPVACE